MHSHSLFSHKCTVSICCACILLAVLFVSLSGSATAVSIDNVYSAADCFAGVTDDGCNSYEFDVNMNLYDYTAKSIASGSEIEYTLSTTTTYAYAYPLIVSAPGLHGAPMTYTSSFNEFSALYSIDGVFSSGDSVTFFYSIDCSLLNGYNSSSSFGLVCYACFYDETGNLLKTYSGTRTASFSPNFALSLSYELSAVVPDDSYFFTVFSAVRGCNMKNGSTVVYSNASISCEVLPSPPPTPTVTSHFNSAYSYNVGDAADRLEVSVSPVSAGDLTYQWYVNTVNSTTGGTPVDRVETYYYRPQLDFLGTRYYYCAVTNALNGLTVTVYSQVCAITVSKVPAKTPTITSHFAESYTYKIGETAAQLVVSASVSDAGVLSYQWYYFNPLVSEIPVLIPNATDSSYLPVLDFVGVRSYFCRVTNTLGDETAYAESASTVVTVKAASYTLQAGQYEMNVASDGLYYPLFPWPEELRSVDLLFRSSGIPYSQMSYRYDLINEAGYYLYYDSDKAYLYAESIEDEGFLSNAYALIFIEADQTVPTEFYEWFIGNFTYVGADEQIPIYYTTINIMDNAGANLLDGVTFPGNGVSPTIYGYVNATGLKIITAAGREWPWSVSDDVESFLGFSVEPGAAAAWYIPGESFTVGGTASDSVVTLYLVAQVSSSVDDDYAASSLKWYERIFYNIGKGFRDLNTSIENGFNALITALAPSEGAKLLGIIDLGSIGEFFKTAYEGLGDFFGLADLLSGDTSPFAWLVG